MISHFGKKIQILCSLVIFLASTLTPLAGIRDSPVQPFLTPCLAADNSSDNLSTDEPSGSGESDDVKDSDKSLAARTIHVPGNFSTIQEAVDDSTSGDTVMVSGGPYYECVYIHDERISLIGTNHPEINASNCGGNAVDIGAWADDCLIQGFELTGASGIYKAGVSAGSHGNTIKNNILVNNFSGIHLEGSNNNTVTGNQLNNNKWGIHVDYCQGNEIQDNEFSNENLGINLEGYSGNNIANNEFTGDGLIVHDSYPNTVEGNTVNGKPLVYLQDKSNIVVPSPAGQVICINCSNITIQDQDLSNTSVGVELVKTQNVIIQRNNISNGEHGIILREANNTEIKDNTISGNDNYGLLLRDSNNNTIYNNYISNEVNVYGDNGQNTWNMDKTEGDNIAGGPYLGGNYWGGRGYWGAYTGQDTDGDGLGDTKLPYNCQGHIVNGGDYHPLIAPEFRLEIIFPEKDFLVLEGLDYLLRVKVTNGEGGPVTNARVWAEITPPNDNPTFYPREGVDGEYLAEWLPCLVGDEGDCTIKVSAEESVVPTAFAAGKPVSKSVTGKVDPKVEITDIRPVGVYHRKQGVYTRFRAIPKDNTYDPLWDDVKPNPSDNDYVGFTYKLNKDVDEVTVTEYKDTWGSANERVGGRTYVSWQEETKKGRHMYYMNVKNLDEDQYFIEVKTRKRYRRGAILKEYIEREDNNWWDRLHIEREPFGHIHIEASANVKTGSLTKQQFDDIEWRASTARQVMCCAIGLLIGLPTFGLGWFGVGLGAIVGGGSIVYEQSIHHKDDAGFIDDPHWELPRDHGSVQDRSLGVRFSTKVFEWQKDRYSEGFSNPSLTPIDLLWLDDSQYIFADIYSRKWENFNYLGAWSDLFVGESPTDMLYRAKNMGHTETGHAVWIRSDGGNNPFISDFAPLNDFGLPAYWKKNRALYLPKDTVPGVLNPAPALKARDHLNKSFEKLYIKAEPSPLGVGAPTGWEHLVEGEPSSYFGLFSKGSSSSATGMYAPQFENLFSTPSDSDEISTGSYSDYGTDTDANGLYDYLTIEIGVNVAEAGTYILRGSLGDGDGMLLVEAANHTDLSAGNQTVPLNFSGMSIHQNGENESYKLIYVSLVDETGELFSHESNLTDGLYTTSLYNYTEFERPKITFTDEFSEHGTDSDGDGLYDYLTVEAGANVEEAGDYYIYGRLNGPDALFLVETENATHLDAGVHNIPLDFDGRAIRHQDVDGPYSSNVELYDGEGNILGHRYDGFQTSDYHGSDFQRAPGQLSGDYSDRGTDSDSDGLYDYLTVDAGVIIDKPGNYRLFGRLHDASGTLVTSATEYLVLETGTQSLPLNFDGLAIRQHGVDGAFNLTTFLSHESGVAETGEHTTSVYSSADFQAPPAEFSGTYSDYGVDRNGDGLFDCLKLEVGINVTAAGAYGISGMLYDQDGAYIASASSYLSLSNGAQMGQLDFGGPTIREHGINGSYNLTSLTLYDESGKQIDYQDMAYTTSAYSYTGFQPAEADIAASPPSFDETVPRDTTRDYTLNIYNDGDATLTYNISDRETTGGMNTAARMTDLRWEPSCEVLAVPAEGKTLKAQSFGEVQAGWQNMMTEDFEGGFPGPWDVMAGDTEAYWGKEDHEPHSGSYSAFCARGGAAGVNPPDNYPNNMNTWMVYGPFSLAGATDAELNFWYWLDTQKDHDYLKCMASIDGNNYSGQQYSGNSLGWGSRSFDLTDVYNLGNLCGESQVWIAFGFSSDESINDEGAFIDDVVLRKYQAGGYSWLDENPKSGSVEPGNMDSVTVTMNTTGLASDRSAEIVISSNDPDRPEVIIPVALHVTAAWDPWAYDEDSSSTIEKSEAIQAVMDYFDSKVTKAQAIEVIMLYFG